MALDNKYRVHEVAKDFGVSTKEITEILTKYRSAPKNHMQVLADTEKRQGSPIRVVMCSGHSGTVVQEARQLLPFTFEL